MEQKPFENLKANPKNPRTINKTDFESLKRSITTFGDLSGVVFNIRTQQLVGGHQRIQAFKSLGGQDGVTITERYAEATPVGTIAVGHILNNGERFPYREVDWSLEKELAANIAANRITGQFDMDLLAEVTHQIQELNPDALILTGQTEDEINRLLQLTGAVDASENDEDQKAEDKLEFKLSAEQREIVEQALYHVKAQKMANVANASNMDGLALYTLCSDYLISLSNEPIPSASA